MADKQLSLRQRVFSGRRKSGDASDNSDSASDSSCNRKNPSESAEDPAPAQPVARLPSRSPSARVPRKLQKRRSSAESSSASATLEASEEQLDAPISETTGLAELGNSRADARRQERHKLESEDTGTTSIAKSRKKIEIDTSLANASSNQHEDGLSLMEVSPLSASNESSVIRDVDHERDGESRKTTQASEDSIQHPDYNDPNPRVGRLTTGRHARLMAKFRGTSPVSPTRDGKQSTRSSPVSPLQGSPNASFDDQEAPLLPHERMEPPQLPVQKISAGATSSSTKYLDPSSARKLRKRPSKKSMIPVPKLNLAKLDEPTGNGGDSNGDTNSKKGYSDTEIKDIHHDAAAAENALLETLRRITSKKQPHTDTEIRAATDEVLCTAATVLDLGPRSPAQRSPALLPPAANVPATPTASPHAPATTVAGGDDNTHRSTSGGSARTFLADVHEEDDSDGEHARGRGRGQTMGKQARQAGPVGGERVRHPFHVVRDRPIVLASGIVQRGYHRWKCCRCHRYTHYENHVCSKLDCLHARCEGHCETFEP